MPDNNVLICEVIKGIVVSTIATSKLEPIELSSSDYDRRDHYLLDSKRSLDFKDYAPNVFSYIRKNFLGLDEQTYLEHWVIPENVNLVQSAGRSGSMFYQTPDKAFFFKTILHAELKIMMGLLNDYVYHQTYQVVLLLDPKHLKTVSGNSFIMRVVGLHRLTHKNLRVWVLVFANSMPYGIVLDDELDLKGRIPKKGKSLKERGRFTPKSVAKKDNELDRGILFLRDKDRKIYTNRLIRDVNFLQSHNLMDYSLLVGIHYVKEEVQQQQSGASKDNKARPQNKERTDTKSGVSYKKETKTYDIQGGRKSAVDEYVYSVDRMLELGGFMGINPKNSKREIYFFGIIDCLTSFSIKKKTAYLFKSILWDKSTLSTVNATYYGHRFITFMTKNLITDKELNYHIDISNRPQSVVLEDEDNTLDELKSTVDSGIISTLEKSRSTLDEQPSLSTYLDKHFSHTRMAASTSA